jgi:ketosteroid isomerase-like protein
MTKLVIILLFVSHWLNGQDKQKEINDHVWKPFIKTFDEYDIDGFMALHSNELIRSAREGKSVLNWDQYYSNGMKSKERDIAAKRKRKIELRFMERVSSDEQAIDVGFYKTSYILSDGSTQSYYGKFLAVLRKENDIWKILVDTDSSEGGTIDEKSFLSANAMDE